MQFACHSDSFPLQISRRTWNLGVETLDVPGRVCGNRFLCVMRDWRQALAPLHYETRIGSSTALFTSSAWLVRVAPVSVGAYAWENLSQNCIISRKPSSLTLALEIAYSRITVKTYSCSSSSP